MYLTNRLNLPQPLVSALSKDDYDIGNADLSVTSLWKPPQMVKLVAENKANIQPDAADYLMNLLGSAFHRLMEEADTEAVVEKRLSANIGGITISGKFDRLLVDRQILQDYKVTSVYRMRNQVAEEDWEQQLNTYAYLLRLHGMDIKAIQVICFLRDWRKAETRNLDYPSIAVQVIDIPLWTQEEAEERIATRIKYFLDTDTCTPEDMWYKPPRWAVMKDGRARAVRLFDSYLEASTFISNQSDKGKLYVQERKATYVRCDEYCAAAPFCPQNKQRLLEQGIGGNEDEY